MTAEAAPNKTPRKPAEKRRNAVLQIVAEVPMSLRQAGEAMHYVTDLYNAAGIRAAKLTGYSVLRGLSMIEIVLRIPANANLLEVARAAVVGFTLGAESAQRGRESEEFAVAFAEVFWEGCEHQPEAVLLPEIADRLGIGGTDETQDVDWASFLARFYNPAARAVGEVRFRRQQLWQR